VGRFAADHNLDLDRVVTLGHSAGGHLALWLAGRRGLDIEDPLRGGTPLRIGGVVALAGIPDLAAYTSKTGCGAAVSELLDGEPGEVPERVGRASPIELLPLGITQILIIGELDPVVPAGQARSYQQSARRMGDSVQIAMINAIVRRPTPPGNDNGNGLGLGEPRRVSERLKRLLAGASGGDPAVQASPTENIPSRSCFE